MGRESNLWNKLKSGMKTRWDAAERHEDLSSLGVADVSFVVDGYHGWMELKIVDLWPKRPETPLRIPHLTDEQKAWLLRKGLAGGRTWLLLQVESDVLLIRWSEVMLVGECPREDLIGFAYGHWSGKIDYSQLATLLEHR